jgi:DNA-directed RNA polymerase III subunit RPC3
MNYDRFNLVIRDELLIKAAADRWNVAAGEIMRALLHKAHQDDSTTSEKISFGVTADAVAESIPKRTQMTVSAGIVTKSKGMGEIATAYLDVMSNQNNLAREANAFLTADAVGSNTYLVEFEAIAVKIRANLLLDMVRAQLGGRHARVLATVAKAHHITEQQVSAH